MKTISDFNLVLINKFHFVQMLLALAGWATGYEGGFPFDKPGDSYGEHRYVGMRVVSFKWGQEVVYLESSFEIYLKNCCG